jgi:hypothetical protein
MLNTLIAELLDNAIYSHSTADWKLIPELTRKLKETPISMNFSSLFDFCDQQRNLIMTHVGFSEATRFHIRATISNPDRSLKKRALWYLMAPAYWILKERKIEILKATSLQEVYDLYQNGSALTYSPAWIVNDLRDLIISIFVTVKVVKPA